MVSHQKESNKNGESLFGMILEKRGFCSVLKNNGETEIINSDNVETFSSYIKKKNFCWVDYVLENFHKETPEVAKKLGFSENLITTLMKEPKGGYLDLDREMGLLLPAIIVKGFDVKTEPLIILIKEGLVATLHTTEVKRFFRMRRYANIFMKKLSNLDMKDKITILLIRIIDENNSRNFDHLREIEEKGDDLSQKLADVKYSKILFAKQIPEMKHALTLYLGGLWSTLDVLYSLRYGDAELLTDDQNLLNRITGLISEVTAHIGLAEHLSEVLVSGLEVLQTIYNNQLQMLNNRLSLLMSYLTIIGTALLVPNTIATVMSIPVFDYEAIGQTNYMILIIVSTILSGALAWWFIKMKGLIPDNGDIV
ncbi:MAG: CorA family divalent cation transporter [Candidatus Diapherotrites archaeon]|nr:CorA family divalent cation transporter [Candidatus Diapherotrites archaeon]